MNTLLAATEAVESTAAATEVEQITTAFTTAKVPMSSIIMYGVGMLIVIAVAIAAVMLIRQHVRNWTYALFAGAVFYLVFNYVIPEAIIWAATMIPGLREWAFIQPNADVEYFEYASGFRLIYLGIRIITDGVAAFLGLKYILKSSEKQQRYFHVGHTFGFALAGFLVIALIGDVAIRFFHAFTESGGAVTSFYQGIQISNMINATGFDPLVSEMVAAGQNVEVATNYLLGFVNTTWFITLAELIVVLCHGVVFTALTVLTYGLLRKKLETKWIAGIIGLDVAFWAGYAVAVFVTLPAWAVLLFYLALAAVAVLVTLKVIKGELLDEAKALNFSLKEEKRKAEEKKNKMPKIVMPKD